MFKRTLITLVSLVMLLNVWPCLAEQEQSWAEKIRAAIGVYIQQLKSPDVEVRRKAASDLGCRAPTEPEAITALLEALKDDDIQVRGQAAIGLGYIGPGTGEPTSAPSEVVLALIEALKDESNGARSLAAQALGNIGPAADAAIPALEEAMKDTAMYSVASRALSRVGPAVTQAIAHNVEFLRRDPPVGGRCYAAQALWRTGVHFGGAARGGIPELIELLKDKDDAVVMWVADALGAMGPAAKPAVPAMVDVVRDTKRGPLARGDAAWSLGFIGPAAEGAVPVLTGTLEDEDIWVSVSAATALVLICPDETPPIDVLIRGLRVTRCRAENGLQYAGPRAKRALPALVVALGEVMAATEALAAQARRAPPARPIMAPYQNSLRTAISSIGPATKKEVPALTKLLLEHEKAKVRQTAAVALRQSEPGPEIREAVPALAAALRDKEVGVRICAVIALQSIGLYAKEAVPALTAATRDADATVRNYASGALDSIRQAEQRMVSMIEALKHERALVRQTTAEALGRMGPKASEAIPALQEALRDENEDVRKAAAEALKKIQGEAQPAEGR
ncbi:MAG: HEAT repeat domain-containing protein [Planctomycetota bacterium]|jgi:HEAT repeat protein